MNVTYEPALVDYMKRKGFAGIVFEQLSAVGCCADSVELYSRFVKEPEAQTMKAQRTWRVVEAPMGELFLARGLETCDEVTLGLKSFLGIKDISYKGIAAFNMRD